MPILSIISGCPSADQTLLERLQAEIGGRFLSEMDLAAKAAAVSGLDESRILRAMAGKTSAFNVFTHEKERALAYLKQVLAEVLLEERGMIVGPATYLIPKEMTHVLRVCLIADLKFRAQQMASGGGGSLEEAMRTIRKRDEELGLLVHSFTGGGDPWRASLYDIVLPMDKVSVDAAAELIRRQLRQEVVQPTAESRQAASDFLLATRVDVALAREGHCVAVTSHQADITLTINKHVLMLGRLEAELKAIAGAVEGVKSVRTAIGSEFHQADIYRKYDFELPSKVLLVDDEREFVQTLSERLQLRDVGSAVAFDGESALDMVNEDDPEVMILDLKMPGIDGIEVLRRVKQTRPEIEVIILSGHGSEQDRALCLSLGAFAYLQKPADIEVLTETLKRANEKMKENLAALKARRTEVI